jgi:TRAP-type mannitol/chloroaromatic compound transport system substrate-binding protein
MGAVSKGQVEIGHSWSGYWLDKDPAFELFSSIPGQMVAQEWEVWMYGPSHGSELWQELYSKYNIMAFPGGLVGPEFGFFTNKPVRTLDDFKGLKLRVSGLAAEVVKELGATTVLTAPDEIKSAMQTGKIDGFEFSTPAVDWPMGFQEVAPYVSLPSCHQPSAMFETTVNKDAFEKLPDDLKDILEAACKEISMVDFMAGLEGANSEYLGKFEQFGTQISILDNDAINKINAITNRLADNKAANNPFYSRVLKSQRDFISSYRKWETWADYRLFSQNEADTVLSTVQRQVTDEMSALTSDIAAAAQKLSTLDLTGSEARGLLNGLINSHAFLNDANTIDNNGRLAAVEPASLRHSEGSDISGQEQIIRLFAERKPVMTGNFMVAEGFEAVVIDYPVFSAGQEIKGAVSVVFQPEILLGNIIPAATAGTKYTMWVMQPDGLITYDADPEEIGKNLFTDPLYKDYSELVALGRGIAVINSGIGEYPFFDTGMHKTVKKQARWVTFELYNTKWKLILVEELK